MGKYGDIKAGRKVRVCRQLIGRPGEQADKQRGRSYKNKIIY